jgi:Fur family ferric uptake transcriptional regulator
MTNASEAPPLACVEIADAVVALRERGLRLSTARRLVLEALFAADGPISAEHIMHSLSLDLTSVYRNLETLERHGLVSHVHLGHGPGLYALRGRGEREYLYCEHCGAVRAVRPEELDSVRTSVRRRFGFEARFTHYAIVGACRACSAREVGDTGTRHPARGDRAMDEHHEHDDNENAHSHEQVGSDGTTHEHAHTTHEHEHEEHEHEHSHGNHIHSHPHVHEHGPDDRHEHRH